MVGSRLLGDSDRQSNFNRFFCWTERKKHLFFRRPLVGQVRESVSMIDPKIYHAKAMLFVACSGADETVLFDYLRKGHRFEKVQWYPLAARSLSSRFFSGDMFGKAPRYFNRQSFAGYESIAMWLHKLDLKHG